MKFYIFIIIFLIVGCSPKDIKKEKESLSVDISHTLFEKDNVENKSFDILNFKKEIDSLLANIFNKNTYSELIIDSIFKDNNICSDSFETQSKNIIENALKKVRYTFVLKNNHNIGFIILSFKDEYTADSIFNIFEHIATTKEISPPGLTYANDYLTFVANEIYWIHTGCLYAYFNHLKFVTVLNNMIENNNISKSIECECGRQGKKVIKHK